MANLTVTKVNAYAVLNESVGQNRASVTKLIGYAVLAIPAGSLTGTLDSLVLSADGIGASSPIDGVVDATLDAIVLSATGELEPGLFVTLDPVTLSAAAALGIAGSLAPVTLASATLSATGSGAITGSLAATLVALILNPGTGAEKFGALTATLGVLSLSANGGTTAGTLATTLGALTSSASGTISKSGQLTRTLSALTLAGTGALANTGALTATLGALTLAATNSPLTFFFAWTTEGSVFNAAMLREDEKIFAFEITHEEGDFPALRLDLKNPKVGLLAAGRNQWCWLSWRNPSGGLIEPLFHGRLIGIPEDLHDEVVRLMFVARPSDYIARKTAVAESLKVRPYWDPVWIAEGQDDPDTAWEARPEAPHIDRVSLDVTSSNTIIGEDGTLTITADDHFYDGMKVAYGDTPLQRVAVTATVTWTQQGEGIVDLTPTFWDAFHAAGATYEYPLISSFTGEGLFSDWPDAGTGIGGGWTLAETATIEEAVWQQAWLKMIVYIKPIFESETVVDENGTWKRVGGGLFWQPAVTHEQEYVSGWGTWVTVFPLLPYKINFPVAWTASRPRTETLSFTLAADTQPLLVDPGDSEEDKLELASAFVAEAVDPGGAMPVGDLRRNSYFNTDRGAQSTEYLIMLARARILARARAVALTVETPLALATRLSCRMNATVLDPRLPGGQGSGKITKYVLSADGDAGELKAEITLGCTVGKANTVNADAGTPTYADDYVDGYQAVTGATLDPGTSDIVYQSFDDLDVIDDDDIDLFRMTPDRVVNSLTITGGPNDQLTALNIFRDYREPLFEAPPLPIEEQPVHITNYVAAPEPSEVLTNNPTLVTLDLTPIGTQSFQTDWAPTVSALMVPKTIDLEAA